MPRGVPKAGFRKPRKPRASKAEIAQESRFAPGTGETDEQIYDKLQERFEVLDLMTQMSIKGESGAMVISGRAGLGKSYSVEKALADWDPDGHNHTIVRGYVRPTGLYKMLWQRRNHGQVLVFDDADSIFADETALNMLKAVTDTTEKRRVSYLAETNLYDDESADIIPNNFVFNGTIIFITNKDFDEEIARGSKMAVHMEAMMSRAHYVDLGIKTKRDYIVRIKQVVDQGMLTLQGVPVADQAEIVDFIEDHSDKLRELSLRMAIKLGKLKKAHGSNWKKMARVTAMRAA